MSQINNNAESLSRELRKLKNIKSVNFKGLLSGNPESYISLFRQLFCENNLFFSRYIVEKGYDLSGLSDFKFMEALYKIMRDLFNLKPTINQNQFFSSGFTQRKLEMSTLLIVHIRKVIFDLNSQTSKKTVQSQSLMKSSLKRSNSAPRQTRVIELGDEEEQPIYSSMNNNLSKTSKTNSKFSTKPIANYNEGATLKSNIDYKSRDYESYMNNVTSESEQSNPDNSYNFAEKFNSTHGFENEYVDRHRNNNLKCPLTQNMNKTDHIDTGNVSAFESSQPLDYDPSYMKPLKYNSNIRIPLAHNNNIDNNVTEYGSNVVKSNSLRTEIDLNDHLPKYAGQESAVLEKIIQKIDTVLDKITWLENRVQRIELKMNYNSKGSDNIQPAPHTHYAIQHNRNYESLNSLHSYDKMKPPIYNDNSGSLLRESRNIISDFESSNYQDQTKKPDFDKLYTSSMYGTNMSAVIKSDSSRSHQSFGSTLEEKYRPPIYPDTIQSNIPKYPSSSITNYSTEKRLMDVNNNSSRENSSYRPNSSTNLKNNLQNGSSTALKKVEKSTFNDNHQIRSNLEKDNSCYIQSQTDRIASLLSDTQKMLKISDEEL